MKAKHRWAILPSKVEDAEAVHVSLIVRWGVYAVHTRLEVVTSQSLESVADVDGNSLVLRLNPLPLVLRVQNLQSSDGLSEKKRDTAEISVARRVKLADLAVQLWRASLVMHVAEVIFALHIVLVVFDELVFVFELKDDGEETEELHYDEVVTLPAECFDLLDVFLENWRLSTLVVAVEFGEVVDLDVVLDGLGESA